MKKEGEFLGVKVMSSPAVPKNEGYLIGADFGQKDGDHSVISRAKLNGKGEIVKIIFDEFAEMPDWKWYRNPIKWYKWRKLWKSVERNMPR